MTNDFRQFLEQELGTGILRASPVSGGDINVAHKLHLTGGEVVFLKYQTGNHAIANLQAEAAGLRALHASGTVNVPEVIIVGAYQKTGFLILPYLGSRSPTRNDWEQLGKDLATLHKVSAESYGFESDNFIGALPQSNTIHETWHAFYAQERLLPQAEQAAGIMDTNFIEQMYALIERLPDLAPCQQPSLIHGDLWGGNKMFTAEGPVLIDPAVCYANREMDIAMSQLFGGFDHVFYEAYQDTFMLETGWEHRIDLYQLYYLLVHVNLFGGSYAGSVMRVLRKYE